jgi:HSP20 family protein
MFAELAFPSTIDRLFSELHRSFTAPDPAFPLSVWSNDQAVVVTAELPGVRPGQVVVDLAGDVLTIATEPEAVAAGSDAGSRRTLLAERSRGRHRRAVQLPCRVDAEHIAARLVDGVLTVALPRAAADRPRTITVT